jgi:hypothetical protein
MSSDTDSAPVGLAGASEPAAEPANSSWVGANAGTEARTGVGLAAHRRRRRVRTLVGVVVVAVIAVVGGGAAVGIGGTGPSTPVHSKLPPATAPVSKATLTQTEQVSGTLGYGAATTLSVATSSGGGSDPGGGGASGTITWLPDPGSVLERASRYTRSTTSRCR